MCMICVFGWYRLLVYRFKRSVWYASGVGCCAEQSARPAWTVIIHINLSPSCALLSKCLALMPFVSIDDLSLQLKCTFVVLYVLHESDTDLNTNPMNNTILLLPFHSRTRSLCRWKCCITSDLHTELNVTLPPPSIPYSSCCLPFVVLSGLVTHFLVLSAFSYVLSTLLGLLYALFYVLSALSCLV